MKNYCVYKHTCPNGKVYIGITHRDPKLRWASGCGYGTQVFGRAIKKYGWKNIEHTILFDDLDVYTASKVEQDLIRKYRATDPRFGYNINGGGVFGNQISDDGRRRLAEYKKRAVNQYTTDGKLIAKYLCVKEASQKTGINRGHISEACLGHRQLKTAGGFVWKYDGELFEKLVYKRGGKPCVKVAQYSKDGEYIKTFESIAAAKKETGARHIRRVLRGENETSGGFVWKEVT